MGVSAKEAHMQCVSDSAEILMVPSVGGWYRACIVTVQRVPSRHQALLAELLNEMDGYSFLHASFCVSALNIRPLSLPITHTLNGAFD